MAKAKELLRLVFCLIFILAGLNLAAIPARAGTLEWSNVNIPASGPGGHWVLADASDKRYLTCAPDGTLYCYANPSGTPFRFFKSSDGGYSWSYNGRVEDDIVDIAIVPDNPNCIFYATSSGIYKSTDAGINFTPIASSPGGAGTSNRAITSLDAVSADGSLCVVVSVADKDASDFGGVYLWKENLPAVWVDAGLLNRDVYTVAFSPDYSADQQIVAVASDEQDVIVATNVGNLGWGATAADARLTGITLESAVLAFPDDYNSSVSQGKYAIFLALNTGSGSGDVYRLDGQAVPAASALTDLNASGLGNTDMISLAVDGNATNAQIIAGAAASAQTYFSEDGGHNWGCTRKPPTGDTATYVAKAPDIAPSGAIYALTSGPESAFSISRDKGATWN